MKHYNDKELDNKINSFLNKKFEKYPELAVIHRDEIADAHPNFAARMIHSLTSRTALSSN